MKLEKIGNIAQFINGYPFKPTDWEDSGKKIIRIQNLTDSTKPYNRTNIEVPEKYLVKKGDILVSWSATIDIFEWNDEDSFLNQHIFKVVFDDKKIIKEYFKQAIKKTVAELAKCAHGATMKHVVKGDFDNHKIPLPPLAEQIQIATVLSKAENLIAKRKQSIELLDEFVKSTFLEMFGDPGRNEKGWGTELCENSVDILTGYPFKSNEYIEDNTQIKLCGGLIIMPDKIEWEKCIYWPKSKMQNLERYELKENDIVLAMDRPWISSGFKIGIIKKEDLPTLLIQRTARLRGKLLNQSFIYHLMKSGAFEKHCRPTETTVPHISIKDINNFKIILPPLPLQNQFAEIVNKVEVLKEKHQKSLEELENLYGSLSQKFLNQDSQD